MSNTGGHLRFTTVHLGRIRLARGLQSLRVKPVSMPHGWVMNLAEVALTPVRAG